MKDEIKKPVILMGVGEMGGVFARGFLRSGYPVYPIGRASNIVDLAKMISDPAAVVVAVGEKDLDATLQNMPAAWKSKLVLLQNELLPSSWTKYQVPEPTVISVWFEKKSGKDVKEIIPSPIYGPRAKMIQEALRSIGLSARVVEKFDDLVFELILKNLYILTTNICGLKVGGNVGELWANYQDVARAVANDVLDIQFHLAGVSFDREELIQKMVKAFEGDPAHQCMGRSAPVRLKRAIQIADEAELHILTLKYIADETKI